VSYVLRELVHLPVEERTFPKQRYQEPDDRIGDLEGLSEGNYLLFAIACRWLKSLVYVHHPTCWDDLPLLFFPESVPEKGVIRLPIFRSDQIDDKPPHRLLPDGIEPLGWEPEVRFERVSCDLYSTSEPFDFAFVSLSPPYTHSSTDQLIPVLRTYISETGG
jgi:hypothetical protein